VTDPVLVRAGWAVWSKYPGTRDDYTVLDSSTEPLSRGEFGQMLKYFTPGNPTDDPKAPGSLPWVMLSRVGVNSRLYLGISIQESTRDKDGTGRPISRTSYFCIPYEELEHTPVSYSGLYAAVARPGLLPHADGGLITLEIPRLNPAEFARIIRDDLDENTVAATAAMLVGGPVTVTGPNFPRLQSRLCFLDAVAALLPYGYRPYLTAATWSDSGADDRFRIVFANRARDEASLAAWGTPPQLPADGAAHEYLRYLRRALGRSDGGDTRLEQLIAYLAHQTAPRKFEEPAQAIADLHGFFLPIVVAEGIDGGTAPVADVRQLFVTERVRELSGPRRTKALQRLIAEADPQDFDLISQWFDEIAVGHPADLLTNVAMACRGQLWSAGSTGLSRDYLQFMSQRGLADELLARLVARPESGADLANTLDAVSQLLAEFVVGAPAGPASYRQTQRALAGNAAAAAALLAAMAASSPLGTPGLNTAADWLEPAADQVVRPFVSLLGDALGGGTPEPVDAAALYELDRDGDPASVRYLLRAASYRSRLHLVLPGLVSWLAWRQVDRGPMTEQAVRYWREVVMELTPASMDEAVWLDLVLLVTSNGPRALLSGRYSQPEFSQRLAAAWRELTVAVDRHSGTGRVTDKLLEDALIGCLNRAPWRADQAQTEAVRNLARSLIAGGPRPRLVSVVLDAREALRQMPPGAPPTQIAQACVRAQANGLTPEQAGGALFESGAVTQGSQAAAILEELHRALAAADARTLSFLWAYDFARMFTRGTFGGPVAADFTRFVTARCGEQLDFRINLLKVIAQSTAPDGPPAIAADIADHLDRLAHELDDVVKDARRHSSRGGIVSRFLGSGKGGPGNEGTQGGETAPGSPGGQSSPDGQGGPGRQGGPG
jgi:hypothetical protein